MGHEGARVTRHVKPGVIVDLQARELRRTEIGDLAERLHDGGEHEGAQLLHAALRPQEQVKAALEELLLGYVGWRRVAVLGGLAGEK